MDESALSMIKSQQHQLEISMPTANSRVTAYVEAVGATFI